MSKTNVTIFNAVLPAHRVILSDDADKSRKANHVAPIRSESSDPKILREITTGTLVGSAPIIKDLIFVPQALLTLSRNGKIKPTGKVNSNKARETMAQFADLFNTGVLNAADLIDYGKYDLVSIVQLPAHIAAQDKAADTPEIKSKPNTGKTNKANGKGKTLPLIK